MTDDSSLLLTLEEISTLVSHCHDPAQTLNNIVQLIQARFQTAVCSVYLLEPEKAELVLSATVGLNPEGIGKVRMGLEEGLTGWVAMEMKPLMVADAFQHPRFKYFPESGEDLYHSYLGVPLVDGGQLQGVLVVQTVEPHDFRPGEVRMLVTVAAQIASLVADAQLLDQIAIHTHERFETTPSTDTRTPLTAVTLSPGKGYGQAYIVDGLDQWRESAPLTSSNAREENRRLNLAIEQARDELTRLSTRVSNLVGEEHGAILQAQLLITQDRNLLNDLQIALQNGASAEGALINTLDKYELAFQKIASAFHQERVFDVKDVFFRILWQLRPPAQVGPLASGDRVVVVAREASVMELFTFDLDRLGGVVVEKGSLQSHAAILARCLGVPMVSQVAHFSRLQIPGQMLYVNAPEGSPAQVVPNPDSELITTATSATKAVQGVTLLELPPGVPRVEVNINLLAEVEKPLPASIPGVGLFRSEFLFLARRSLPTEEQQLSVYRKLIKRLDGRPVTIRTFDLRPDKLASLSNLSSATSRPLDWRLVLESPPLQQLFLEQVRAILRAATLGPVRILVPLVTRSELLDFVVQTVKQAREGLSREGLAFAADVPLGVMIEVSAAIPLVTDWTHSVSFFALGTNDLAASALGIDRDDPLALTQIDPLHPGILCLIEDVVSAVRSRNCPISVCGEMAADPLGAIALAALQIHSLSVPVNQFVTVQTLLSSLSADQLIHLKPHLLRQRTASGIRAAILDWQKNLS